LTLVDVGVLGICCEEFQADSAAVLLEVFSKVLSVLLFGLVLWSVFPVLLLLLLLLLLSAPYFPLVPLLLLLLRRSMAHERVLE
jgi:hypothetical protein